MVIGKGILIGHLVTIRRFLLTFTHDFKIGEFFKRRGGGDLAVDFYTRPKNQTIVKVSSQSSILTNVCLFTNVFAFCRF